MNVFGILISIITSILLMTLPRRWAPLPFLAGVCYMPIGDEIEIGPLHFPVIRILIVVGFLRITIKSERMAGELNSLDKMMVIWAVWTVLSSFFHSAGALILHLGIVFNALGSYFFLRIFVRDLEDFRNICKLVCVVFVPVAAAMVLEKLTGKNSFALLGSVPAEAALRHGHFRARGPFGHAILAGTAGAVCFPMALVLWQENRKLAVLGLFATGGVLFASGSSGPVMTVLTILFGMALWMVRGRLRTIRWLAILLIIALDMVMKDPVYYLIAKIDITGGSTGWHRAALIGSAIEHLNEWWVAGTDVTRHWMPTGVYSSAAHTDITNHYIAMGVWGGLPLMLLFMGVLWVAFVAVGKALRRNKRAPVEDQFLIWTLGAILFGHTTTFLSVSYFDQTVVFLYLVLAAIGSLHAMKPAQKRVPKEDATIHSSRHESDICYHR